MITTFVEGSVVGALLIQPNQIFHYNKCLLLFGTIVLNGAIINLVGERSNHGRE